MVNRADALAMLSSAGLSGISQQLETLIQDSIRITVRPVEDVSVAIGASKLGGEPDLPEGSAWPTGKGLPLSFIAQIRLADVAPFDPQHALPPSGLLSFFYDATQQTYGADPADRGGWTVVYVPGDSGTLQRVSTPVSLPNAARFKPGAAAFTGEVTLPQQPELDIPNLTWTAEQKQAYENALATFPSQADRALPHHRLLGSPDTIQDDMRLECQLAANGVSDADAPAAAPLKAGARNWRLLLQVDSDDTLGMRWADAGMVYFWIENDALAARRFENVWVVLQSD
jgi:uncharacterized protein YwqG